ncbi:MAG: hypothetical protein JRI64_10535, partial [Deltaproteobacteria bacterium]|nr:hypothetical protein [Deltaproteobacteria bacterium]
LDNIELWIQKLGIELDRDEAMSVLQVVKQQSHDLKRVLTEDEFSKIVREVKA